MSDVTIKYKGQAIATMDATGSKTLQTQGKYCEGDIGVEYVKPAAPTGTKQISITQNGTTTEDVAAYANAEISVNVSGGVDEDFVNLVARDQTIISNSYVEIIGYNAFRGYSSLISASFPNAHSIAACAFQECSNLSTLSLPNLTTITGGNSFSGCPAILVLPKLTTYPTLNAINASKATAIDLGETINRIEQYMFQSSTNMSTLILRKTTLASLTNINAFQNTPFASGKAGGTLYVPQALISDYQAATNWSTILGYANNSIAAIEGSIYETQYADGTPIT